MAKRKYEINEHFFDVIDTENKAYWLGFLYADGYNNEKKHEIKLRLSIKDEDFLLKFRNTIYLNKDKPVYYQKRNPNKKEEITSCEVVIHSKYISDQLAKFGCMQKKTFKLSFPEWLDESLYSHFIRGVFDGDGCIALSTLKDGNHKTMFSIIGYRPFIQKLNQIISEKCDLNCNQLIDYKGKDERIATLAFSGCRQCIKIRDFLYKNATVYMQRKYDKFMLLGTDKWRTYENFNKERISNEMVGICCRCNKILIRKHKTHQVNEDIYCSKCFNKSFVTSKKITENNIIIKDNISILLIKDKEICFDTEDINIVEQYKWHIENGRVVSRQVKPKKCFYLNRLIMNAKDGESVAFKDGNRFNMKKENLEKRNHR